MTQILLIGGKRDGTIEEGKFVQDGPLRFFNTKIVSSRIGSSDAPVDPIEPSIDIYHMDAIRIEGRLYAYATCRSIQGYEIVEMIKNSGLKPIE